MSLIRPVAACLLCAALLILGACGGGGAAEPTPTPVPAPLQVQVDVARVASATIGAAGGSVTATAADGRRYTLTVPAGALAVPNEITAAPVLSMGDAPLAAGLQGAVRFGPAGLRFAVPATLRIEGANTVPAPGTSLVGFNRSADGRSMALGLPVVRSGAIELQVLHFSDVGVSQATPEQVAAVPAPEGPAETADAVVNAIFDALGREHASVPADRRTDTDVAAMFIRVHDALVAPRLRAAALATPGGRDLAITAARAWLVFTLLSFDADTPVASLPGGLGSVITAVQQQLLGVLTTNFDAGLAECTAEPPSRPFQVAGLVSALRAAQVAVDLRNVRGGLPGLDAVTVGRRLNDCVRVVFVPRPLPTFETGRQASLDVQAQLIFANSASTPETAAFAFTLSSDDAAIASPAGFSDAQGGYTSVVTPRVATPRFNVRACMVVVDDFGTNVGSQLCGATTLVGGPEGVVLAGQATRSFSLASSASNGSFSLQGTVDFRVRAGADGRFTVLEARGTVTEVSSGDGQCSPDGGLTTITRRLTERREHTITSGSHFGSGVGSRFQFQGSTTRTIEFMRIENGVSDCSLQTTVLTETDDSRFGNALIIAIEPGADGKPAVITLGGSEPGLGEVTGSLARE
jgi:hypothetical protein